MEDFNTSASHGGFDSSREDENPELREWFHWGRERSWPLAVEIADELCQQLASDEPVDFTHLRHVPFPTPDVEDNIQKLGNLLHVLRRTGSESIRCVQVEEIPIPISVEENFLRNRLRENEDSFDVRIENALLGVRHHLARFLADRLGSRFFAIRGFAGGMSNTPNLLSVRVSSQSRGARVSYSPAYFINYVALAAPTSPVQGFIMPGRYVFMLTTPGPRYLTDRQVFDIPPTFSISLMV